ncbi:MAG: hypothetical protein RRA15_13300, partial [bacterium]|nr:hypothetical protein [bacterium]
MKKLTALLIVVMLAIPFSAFALSQEEIEKEIGNLKEQVNDLSKDNEKLNNRLKSSRSPITITGDYQFRIDVLEGSVPDYFQFNDNHAAWMASAMNGVLKPPPAQQAGYNVENDELWTNRFGLNI